MTLPTASSSAVSSWRSALVSNSISTVEENRSSKRQTWRNASTLPPASTAISRFASAKTCGCAAAGTAVPARKAARVAWAAGRFKSAGPLGWMARREATAQTRRNWGIAPHGRHAFSAGVVLPEPLGEIVHEQPDLDRQIAPVRIDGED